MKVHFDHQRLLVSWMQKSDGPDRGSYSALTAHDKTSSDRESMCTDALIAKAACSLALSAAYYSDKQHLLAGVEKDGMTLC